MRKLEMSLSNKGCSQTTFLTLLIALLFAFAGKAQIDTSLTLVSKMDFQAQYELHDGNQVHLMGYTKTLGAPILLPSPTLEFEEGDSVHLTLWNMSQAASHTIHLHGLDVDQANDGVPHLSFEVAHDDSGHYYFQAPHPGTYLYHCHFTSVLHVQAGMYGLLIVKPKSNPNLTWENGFEFDSEHAFLMSELDTNWHHDSIINAPHDPQAMTHTILPYYPQHFLINGKSETQLDSSPINASVGEKVYMRLANIGYYANQVIFPSGMNAQMISSDGRPLPTVIDTDTVMLYPGERYGVLLEANSEFSDVIQIDYVNMNTHLIENTQEVDVNIAGFIGIEELGTYNNLVIPNPASSQIKLPLSGKWSVLDLSGREVTVLSSTDFNYDVSGLSIGTYVLRNVERPEWCVKLSIQR